MARRAALALLPALAAALAWAGLARAAAPPASHEHDFVVRDFRFKSGETLPELKLHVLTLGQPERDERGQISNAVLILHGTGGTGRQFLSPQFAGVLYGPGAPLDTAHTWVILPDGIGHGHSSKPSDGLHARFPHYDYADMVEAQYRLVTEDLGITHLQLVMGTSMGGMQTWLWGEAHADFMDALMPLGCLPVEIGGRNRLWRRMVMDAIRDDPDWKGGEYKSEPRRALVTALDLLLIAGSAPIQMQKSFPSRDSADRYLASYVATRLPGLDANDLLYQVDASRDYDPSPKLETIDAPLTWVNSGDDFINPPGLGIAEREIKRVRHGRFILVPESDQTHGHGTHTWAAIWKQYLIELLATSTR